MPVTTVAILFLLAAVALEAAFLRPARRSGWSWFGAWAIAGLLAGFATLSFAVGLLVLPFALVAIFAVSRFAVWPDVIGLAAGAGLTAVAIAAINLDAAGGPDPGAWLAAGALTIAASAIAYAALAEGRPRRCRTAV